MTVLERFEAHRWFDQHRDKAYPGRAGANDGDADDISTSSAP
jgi:hypothetical protein